MTREEAIKIIEAHKNVNINECSDDPDTKEVIRKRNQLLSKAYEVLAKPIEEEKQILKG